jgi:iron complex outermembrane recepter protein
LLDVGGGSEEQNGGVRYGVELDENAHFRTYAKAKYLDDTKKPGSSEDNYDHWHLMQGGFRFDSEGFDKTTFTFQGDIYKGSEKQETILFSNPNLPPEVDRSDNEMDGSNLIARWSKEHSPGSISTLQTYFDHIQRDSVIFDQAINTFDVDFQHSFKPLEDHEIIAGLGYRFIEDDYDQRSATVEPDHRDYDVYSAFLQDEIFLIPEKFSVTIGSKFEENNFSGFEYQPSIRLNGILNDHNSLWAAVSRAVRTPSRADQDIRLPFGPPVTAGGAPVLLQVQGNRDKDSEKLIAYEVGYRARFSRNVSLDISFFYNDYDDLTTGDPGNARPGDAQGSFFVVPLLLSNSMHGETFGVEAIKTINLYESWKIQAGYTFIQDNLRFDDPAAMSVPQEAEDEVPNHMAIVRSSISLTDEIYFDSNLRYMDSIKVFSVEDYLELNMRLAWVVNPNLELSLSGENLLHDRHQEAVPDVIITSPAEIERSFFARAIFKF